MYRHLQTGVHLAPLCEGMAVLTLHDDQYFLLDVNQTQALLRLLGGGGDVTPAADGTRGDDDAHRDAATRWTEAFERRGLLRPEGFDAPDPIAEALASRTVSPLAGFTGWRLNPEDLGMSIPFWQVARAWWAVRQSHRITARTRMPGLLRWLYCRPRAGSPRVGADASARAEGPRTAPAATIPTSAKSAKSAKSAMSACGPHDTTRVGDDVGMTEHAIIAQSIGALNRACLLYPRRTKCLEWSAALVHVCQRRGVDVDLVIGVSGGPFSAHAWVEHAGAVVGDDPGRRAQFAVIVDGRTWRRAHGPASPPWRDRSAAQSASRSAARRTGHAPASITAHTHGTPDTSATPARTAAPAAV